MNQAATFISYYKFLTFEGRRVVEIFSDRPIYKKKFTGLLDSECQQKKN
jgi:hypothetical protein